MDNAHALPDDLDQCHELLLAAFTRAAELERVLDETAASHEELKAAHEATTVELNRLKQWVFGRRSERIVEGVGQQHLFDLQPETTVQPDTPIPEPPGQQVTAHSRRRDCDRQGRRSLRGSLGSFGMLHGPPRQLVLEHH